jgi:hypothetical protein
MDKAFKYTVKGNDGTEYTGRVEVLVEKVADTVDSDEPPGDSTANADSATIVANDSSTTSITERRMLNIRKLQLPTRGQGYRDLKGRRYSKQVPYRVLF